MYRLLIADDEALEREGLEHLIHRMLPDMFQIAFADNGRRAIEQAEEFRPHIIMMDINMPGIQGLQAIREIKSRLPDTKFILVTAYDFFAYAKEAVSLGVKEYIVKPAGREQISSTLNLLIEELERDKSKRNEELLLRDKVSQLQPLVENELSLLLMVDQVLGADEEKLSDWLSFPLDEGCAVVVAFPKQIYTLDKKKLYETFRSFTKTYGVSCIVSSLIDLHMAVFIRVDAEERSWKSGIKPFGEKLCRLAERQFELPITVGIGSVQSGADGWRKSYFEAVFASDVDRHAGEVRDFEELVKGAAALPADPFTAGDGSGPEDQRSYVISALQRIREQREQQTINVMDKAKHYIGQHFTEELSLEETAEHVHLNPHYFSKVFKQQAGATFIDYLTGLRIEKAKQLISSADELALKEVCFEVGYKDPNYFSRVFKRVTGLTPTEYRSQAK
ncbi:MULTISPECIES: response regulator [unclassified Paenibacillus]|uniref:response regulator n=1 Tax=unclassified Paenibacillus TaxID=185978 RepID=UPI00104AAC7E|nr:MULTISPECIES: response regulator [unclassified Paenibacillus]NIK66768.1 two-component system response regulator YesN [Paenibacillus sp. BK720]TCN00748.1 two-component system response regulator YesN [Paenibacillus sp. BK033]